MASEAGSEEDLEAAEALALAAAEMEGLVEQGSAVLEEVDWVEVKAVGEGGDSETGGEEMEKEEVGAVAVGEA